MIIHVTDGSDPRLDPFRWRDRQLASRLDRLDAVGAGMFVAEGDLVVDRAIELRYEAIALLCDEPTGIRLAEIVDESVQQQLNDSIRDIYNVGSTNDDLDVKETLKFHRELNLSSSKLHDDNVKPGSVISTVIDAASIAMKQLFVITGKF